MPEEAVRMKLRTFTQGGKSMTEFVARWSTYATQSGYDDLALCDMFERAVDQRIALRILARPKPPKTPGEWYEQALTYSRRQEHSNALVELNRKRPGVTMSPAQTRAARDPSTIWCYNCGKFGHITADCPEPAKPLTTPAKTPARRPRPNKPRAREATVEEDEDSNQEEEADFADPEEPEDVYKEDFPEDL